MSENKSLPPPPYGVLGSVLGAFVAVFGGLQLQLRFWPEESQLPWLPTLAILPGIVLGYVIGTLIGRFVRRGRPPE